MKRFNLKRIFTTSLLLTALIIGCAFTAKAQTTTPAASTVSKGAMSYIDVFFKKYKVSSDSAIDYLFSTNKLFTGNTSQINQLKQKLDSLQLNIGKYIGKELISQKSATPSLVLYSFLVKHENQPIRFTFMFYKPQNEWELYRFNYDDAMDIELMEAAKINNKRAQ
jgi:hypothetical protein